jgi:hypothetical protein
MCGTDWVGGGAAPGVCGSVDEERSVWKCGSVEVWIRWKSYVSLRDQSIGRIYSINQLSYLSIESKSTLIPSVNSDLRT